MKFDCGPTRAERIEAKERWHTWFAWHPIRISSGDCRWLERVERRGSYFSDPWGGDFWTYEYHPLIQD